jgi:hypothetical protein
LTTEDASDCEDFGHEWIEYIEMYGCTEIHAGWECMYCGEEREDV